MAIRALGVTCLCLALAAVSAGATAQPAPTAPQRDFRSLFTPWSAANDSSLRIEQDGVEQVREDYATAGSRRRHALENEGRALGERVAEVVRSGDCAEGERIAREAGDFALVEAVRDHCAAADPGH